MAKINWSQCAEDEMMHDKTFDDLKAIKPNRLSAPIKISYEVEGIHVDITLPVVPAKELVRRLLKITDYINEAQEEIENWKY